MGKILETTKTPEIYLEEINYDDLDLTGFKVIHQRNDFKEVLQISMDSLFKTNKNAWIDEFKIGFISNIIGGRILYIAEKDFPDIWIDTAVKALDNYLILKRDVKN